MIREMKDKLINTSPTREWIDERGNGGQGYPTPHLTVKTRWRAGERREVGWFVSFDDAVHPVRGWTSSALADGLGFGDGRGE